MNHAYLDRLTVPSNSIVWRPHANHGQKRELGGVAITRGDLTSPAPLQKGVYSLTRRCPVLGTKRKSCARLEHYQLSRHKPGRNPAPAGSKSRTAVGLLHHGGMLTFRSEARETLGGETARVHHAARNAYAWEVLLRSAIKRILRNFGYEVHKVRVPCDGIADADL